MPDKIMPNLHFQAPSRHHFQSQIFCVLEGHAIGEILGAALYSDPIMEIYIFLKIIGLLTHFDFIWEGIVGQPFQLLKEAHGRRFTFHGINIELI